MYKEHGEFRIEKTKDLPLWRYMDFWKFLSLINTSKLFFPNVEMLGDQHEGRIPQKVYDLYIKEGHDKILPPNFYQDYTSYLEKKIRPKILICSWIASKTESFAMWKMYAKEKLGIAIKTNHERLREFFNASDEDIRIGEVSYYDDTKPKYRLGNAFYTFLVKHIYYAFESEVRCIAEIRDNEEDITYKNIDVHLNTLIEEIYISPFAYETGFDQIIDFLKSKHSLNFEIKMSGVNDKWI